MRLHNCVSLCIQSAAFYGNLHRLLIAVPVVAVCIKTSTQAQNEIRHGILTRTFCDTSPPWAAMKDIKMYFSKQPSGPSQGCCKTVVPVERPSSLSPNVATILQAVDWMSRIVKIFNSVTGAQDGATPAEALNIAQMQFIKADTNKDNLVSFEEFERHYQSATASQARKNFHLIVGQQAASESLLLVCALACLMAEQISMSRAPMFSDA